MKFDRKNLQTIRKLRKLVTFYSQYEAYFSICRFHWWQFVIYVKSSLKKLKQTLLCANYETLVNNLFDSRETIFINYLCIYLSTHPPLHDGTHKQSNTGKRTTSCPKYPITCTTWYACMDICKIQYAIVANVIIMGVKLNKKQINKLIRASSRMMMMVWLWYYYEQYNYTLE